MAGRIDVLLKIYDDHATQARRHEEQRDRMTNLILVISGALIALATQSGFAYYSIPAAIAVILLGIYGLVFARKHYERNQLHTSSIREVRNEIDRELGIQQWPESDAAGPKKRTLRQIRDDADREHYNNFPRPMKDTQKNAKSKLARIRLHYFWEGLHVVVVVLGVILLGAIVFRQLKAPVV